MSKKRAHLTQSLYQFIANYISESNQNEDASQPTTSSKNEPEKAIESSQETSTSQQMQYTSTIDSNDEKEINFNTEKIDLNEEIREKRLVEQPELIFTADTEFKQSGNQNFLKGCKWYVIYLLFA
jgi:hypothetical protein